MTVWDLETGEAHPNDRTAPLLLRLPGSASRSFDVSPDGGSIAAGGAAGPEGFGGEAAGAWDAATGEKLFRIGHPLDVNDVAFSPDGEHLVTASWDGSAKIIDRSGGVLTS